MYGLFHANDRTLAEGFPDSKAISSNKQSKSDTMPQVDIQNQEHQLIVGLCQPTFGLYKCRFAYL
jgi:hypothetical protein